MSKNCEKIQVLHEKAFDKRIGLFKAFRVKLHLMICKCCKDYVLCSKKLENSLKYNGTQKQKCTNQEKDRIKNSLIN